ncbi:hypothetical protein CC86DRAFT_277379, partial [Ophiobolus disseminans]
RFIELSGPEGDHLRLVKGASCGGNYLTLSYRWGEKAHSTYITTTVNYKSRQAGFSMSSMPATIGDAIKVAHWIGVKSIWIDASCIIQDSKRHWEKEGARMDQVYSGSYLTISADDAPDAQSGFIH